MPADAAPPFVCRFARGNEAECGMPFGNKRALATHQGLVHTADEIGATYRCPMPGCLFGTNTERYLNRHVSNMHGGIFTPVLYFAGEALMMTAKPKTMSETRLCSKQKTSHSLKGQNRAALRSNFDAYAEGRNSYTAEFRLQRWLLWVGRRRRAFIAGEGVPLQPIAMSSAIDGIFMEVQAVGRIRAKL
ncbi:hypothetical protein niasHT_038637 [Heterodera trifolii]|uniref:C2H2-type domain-containing protein n=1 Tax=Heterodera trifolii TaxID=157864 RepID=A0ABD2HY96_9BILA